MNGTQTDEMLDIDASFRDAAKKHGRGVFALVMHAGMARQAVEVLGRRVQHDPPSLHAVGVLAAAFNHTSSALAKAEGWTEEMMLECDRDIQLAFSRELVVPRGKIVLAH